PPSLEYGPGLAFWYSTSPPAAGDRPVLPVGLQPRRCPSPVVKALRLLVNPRRGRPFAFGSHQRRAWGCQKHTAPGQLPRGCVFFRFISGQADFFSGITTGGIFLSNKGRSPLATSSVTM